MDARYSSMDRHAKTELSSPRGSFVNQSGAKHYTNRYQHLLDDSNLVAKKNKALRNKEVSNSLFYHIDVSISILIKF